MGQCKYCHKGDMEWVHLDRMGYRLVDPDTGEIHTCDKYSVSSTKQTGRNRYGVDMGYVSNKIHSELKDLTNYTPEELSRVLVRLAMSIEIEEAKREVDRIYKTSSRGD